MPLQFPVHPDTASLEGEFRHLYYALDALTQRVDTINFDPGSIVAAGIDHGGLAGLLDDDHPQYHNDLRGDARYYLQSQVDALLASFVAGPASATDNAIARFDGATGKLIQDSAVSINDTGVLFDVRQVNFKDATGNVTTSLDETQFQSVDVALTGTDKTLTIGGLIVARSSKFNVTIQGDNAGRIHLDSAGGSIRLDSLTGYLKGATGVLSASASVPDSDLDLSALVDGVLTNLSGTLGATALTANALAQGASDGRVQDSGLTSTDSGASVTLQPIASNRNLELVPNGTGLILLDGDVVLNAFGGSGARALKFEGGDGLDKHVILKGPASVGTTFTLLLPATDGSADDFLQTDGSGNLSFAAASLPGHTHPSTEITDFTEAAQDAVGTAMTDTPEIDFTYSDVANTISATLIADSIVVGRLHATATDVFFGRDSALAGPGEEITVGAAKTLLNLSGTNTGDQTITLTGDVTGSGTGSFATTIQPGVVTLSKMGNLDTDKLIGRISAGTGPPEAVAFSNFGQTWINLADAAAGRSTLGLGTFALETQVLTTRGDLLVTNSGPVLTRLPIGSDGQVLTADTASTPGVKWAAAAGGGAPVDVPYVTLGNDATLTGERVLTAGDGIELTDGGANTTVTLKTHSFVYITDLTGAGTISNKTYEANTVPANKILTAAESDNDSITVELEIHALSDAWQPASVTVSGGGATPVVVAKQSWTQVGSSRIWTATAALTDATTTGTITATMSDGDTDTFSYTRALDPPLVTGITVDNQGTNPDPYPGIQTELANGQTFKITVTTETHANEVYIKDFEATSSRGVQGPFTVTAGSTGSITITAGNAEGINQRIKAYAKVTGGTPGADFISVAPQDVDCSQTAPTFGGPSYVYPAGQEALKNSETCDVTLTHNNPAAGDIYSYDDNSTGELTIPAATTYAATKTVTRLSGNYRESGTNYRVTATRTEKNGLSATASGTVKIAHTTPVITITGASSRLGTDNGTNNYKDHTITIQSSQANLSTYTGSVSLAVDSGDTSTWQGSWVASGSLNYTRSLRVADGDIAAGGQTPNNYTWGAVSVKNRAAKEATIVTTNTTYQLGGFDTRTINMGPITGAYTHTGDIGVPVVDTSKTTVANTSKGGTPALTYEAIVTHHNDADSSLNNFWTTVTALASETFDDFSQYFHCSDKKFYDSVTAPGGFNCTVAESA